MPKVSKLKSTKACKTKVGAMCKTKVGAKVGAMCKTKTKAPPLNSESVYLFCKGWLKISEIGEIGAGARLDEEGAQLQEQLQPAALSGCTSSSAARSCAQWVTYVQQS